MLEQQISEMESEKRGIESELNAGKLSSKELYEKSGRLAEILELLEEKEIRWIELNEK